jgi:hypothetical protein
MKYASGSHTFWIDALCIDQGSIKEKNHQVAQMGSIYSNAVDVVSWLGHSEGIGRAFAFALEINALREGPVNPSNLWWRRNEDSDFQLKKDWLEFVGSQYWKRAWITQEILLARRVKLLVNDTEVDARRLSTMRRLLRYINIYEPMKRLYEEDWHDDLRVFKAYLDAMCGLNRFREQRLLTLFHGLPRRQSERPRDRIYSLLSIASDWNCIPVDYGSSDIDVLLHVVRVFRTSMCVCFWLYVVTTFEYRVARAPEHGFSSKMPIFEMLIEIADTELFVSVELNDWYDMCSNCHTKIPDLDQTGRLFCFKKFCNCSETHFYLKRYHTNIGQRYTVQNCGSSTEMDVIRVQIEGGFDYILCPNTLEIDQETNDDISTPLFRIWLTADVLTQLLQHDTRNGIPEAPLQLCLNAREERGRLVSHNTHIELAEDEAITLSNH